MPTGYTAELCEKGQSFEEFIWRCARAFGACIMMRDDPLDKLPSLSPENDSFYAKEVQKYKNEVVRLGQMSDSELETLGLETLKTEIASYEESSLAHDLEQLRLREMLTKVEAWNPPTEDHTKLKEFMIEQIKTSQSDYSYQDSIVKLKAKTPKQRGMELLVHAREMVERYSEELRKEIERNKDRLSWLTALHESVPQPQRN